MVDNVAPKQTLGKRPSMERATRNELTQVCQSHVELENFFFKRTRDTSRKKTPVPDHLIVNISKD